MTNNSKIDILKNQQSKYKRVKYKLLDMIAVSDCGKFRNEQQDSVLLLVHPNFYDFKLLAVADGMGGLANGALASNIALRDLISWFENLPNEIYIKDKNLCLEIKNILEYIDLHIRKECFIGGTTLALVIVNRENTFITNVGDSRIYIDSKSCLKQISIDHSISWDLFLKGEISLKDNIRFHKKNNLITSRLGCEKKKLIINDESISNDDYDKVFLFSDGVTDCLSDEVIHDIIMNTPNEKIADEIINQALIRDSINKKLDICDYYDIINGGKDNASVAALIKR